MGNCTWTFCGLVLLAPFSLLDTSCPFGLLILAVLAPLGLMGPSWPYRPLLAFRAPLTLLGSYWSFEPLLTVRAPLAFFGPSWLFWPFLVFLASLCIVKSLRYNLDARNHKTNSLRSYYWLFGYVDFLGVARQVVLLPWIIVDICTYSGLFSSRHGGILKNVLRH